MIWILYVTLYVIIGTVFVWLLALLDRLTNQPRIDIENNKELIIMPVLLWPLFLLIIIIWCIFGTITKVTITLYGKGK